jgi:aminoglycoside/choline kinase family phosphotransferase
VEADRLTAIVFERLGRRVTSIEPIAAGMGARRFHRLHFSDGTPESMVARSDDSGAASPEPAKSAPRPPPSSRPPLGPAPAWLPEPPLEPLRSFLEAAGLPVPKSFGHFPELGLDLLEDVGTRNLLGADPRDREGLYREACALVPRLQRLAAKPDRIPAFGRRYDAALVDTKLWKWLNWAIPGLLRREANAREREDLNELFTAIVEDLEGAPRRLAHRDFKAENLHLRPPGAGGRPSLVMIDVQGAFIAPPEYDLVCLLYDLQTDLDESLAMRLLAEVVPSLPDHPSSETVRRRFDALAVARLAKDVAHVVHAGRVRGDWRRWAEIPRGLELLERAAGRLETIFPGVPTLISVIHALTTAAESADIASEGTDR